jgi:hypothetical protein
MNNAPENLHQEETTTCDKYRIVFINTSFLKWTQK